MADEPVERDTEDHLPGTKPKHYVALGASAGGLEALQEFFSSMPADTGVAIIVVQHLAPDFKSLMDELLSRHTQMPVRVAEEGMEMLADNVYLIPPNKIMTVKKGCLQLADRITSDRANYPIDIFFQSLAIDQPNQTIAVILSGTGSDGSRGIRAVKEEGGLVIVQEPASAKFDGMPLNAINSGVVDVVTNVNDISSFVVQFLSHPFVNGNGASIAEQLQENDVAINQIFKLINGKIGIDFLEYKKNTIFRRIERRLQLKGLTSLREYHASLLNDPDEIDNLTKDLLIGVTRFFRDEEAYRVLAKTVVPELLSSVPQNEDIRIWVAGCSTGEEAYSVAIVFDEVIKACGESRSVKVFATDVDPNAISAASVGEYPENVSADISAERLNKYFEAGDGVIKVTQYIRNMVVYARHNLLQDPPFSNTHLTLCRNVLIYFQPDAQRRIISMLQFSLIQGGYLFLGSSETLSEFKSNFSIISERHRIYKKTSVQKLYETNFQVAGKNVARSNERSPSVGSLISTYKVKQAASRENPVLDCLIEDYVPPCILLNSDLEVVHVYGDVSPYMQKIKSGRFSAHISQYIHDDLSIAVTTAAQRALSEQQDVQYDSVELKKDEAVNVTLSLRARYICPDKSARFIALLFLNSQEVERIEESNSTIVFDVKEQAHQRILDLEYQLKKNQESLQATVEELETTNEELQSSNEELLASNEELQSTNEELQSVNEELYTVNSEYQEKIMQLQLLNSDLDNIITSIDIGIVLLDSAMLIRKFSPAAMEEINMLPSDLGRPFHHISHSLIYDNFLNDIATVLEKEKPIEKELASKGGHHVNLRLIPYRNNAKVCEGCVIVLSNITEMRRLEKRLNDSYSQLHDTIKSAFSSKKDAVRLLIVDDDDDDIELIKNVLRTPNSFGTHYEIVSVNDTGQALSMLDQKVFDVCLLDFNLNKMTAFEFVELLKEEKSSTYPAFIILSGVINPNHFQEASEKGVYDIIDKNDMSPQLLERSIRYTLRHRKTESYLSKQQYMNQLGAIGEAELVD